MKYLQSLSTRFAFAVVFAITACATNVHAQQAGRQGRIVVPSGPGASSDIVGRLVASRMGEALGMPYVVDNRPGGGTTIGTELVAKAAPDGATLLLSQPSTVISSLIFPNLKYDTSQFAAVTILTRSPLLLAANLDFPPKTFAEFIQYARANTGKVNFGSLGVSTSHHVTGEMLKLEANVDMVHVPYKGGASAAHADLMGGRIQIMFDNMPALLPHVRSGRLRPLATSGLRRSAALPQVPTIAESGYPGFESTSWFGIFSTPGTPKDVVARLNRELVKILATREANEQLIQSGAEVVGNSQDEADSFFKSELARWSKVAKAVKLGVD